MSGLISGLGAATADAIYGCVAAFGLTSISDVFIGQKMLLRLVGGGFLCCLGVRTLLSKPNNHPVPKEKKGLLGAYASTFFLTLANPMTILSFAAIIGGFGIPSVSADYASASLIVLGVFSGSTLWWLLLSWLASLLAPNITRWLVWVNRISGLIIITFAAIILSGLAS